jgi:hypothetical protein
MSAGRDTETVALDFIEAANRRDAEALIALTDPEIALHPTILVGDRRSYHGHDGLQRWLEDLDSSRVKHTVRVREVRTLSESEVVALSELLVNGEPLAESALFARLDDGHRIIEVKAYISDAEMLARLGRIDPEPPGEEQLRDSPPLRERPDGGGAQR